MSFDRAVKCYLCVAVNLTVQDDLFSWWVLVGPRSLSFFLLKKKRKLQAFQRLNDNE